MKILLLGFSLAAYTPKTVKEFHPKFFWERPQPGLYDVDLGFKDGYKIMALGDVDSDGYSDIVTVNQ